jgi:hypothetical protein
METLKLSFEEVADWCERHLEAQRGREIGMTFGAMIRAYGRLATLSSRLHGEERDARTRQLNAKAEELLLELSRRFLGAYGWVVSRTRVVYPTSMRTNMIYDTGPRPKE